MTTAYDQAPDDLSTLERTQPNDIPAEQAALGAALINKNATRHVLATLIPEDYYRPAHATIHRAIAALVDRGQPIDGITISAELQAAGELHRVGGGPYIHSLIHNVPVTAHVTAYTARVREMAKRRALIAAATEITQAAYAPGSDPDDTAEHAVALTRDARDAGRATEDRPVEDIHDFLAVGDEDPDWILPGYLERMDRVIWTAGEGGGKSVLLRQIAITAAAGHLPFGGINELGPQKVLVLDCENSEAQSRRRYRALMNTAERQHRGVKRGQLHIHCRPEGVDLTKADGRAWLMRRVEAVMPDLLVIGPIYQLHAGDPNSEELARKITVALTEARVTAGCALVMEAHAAKANGIGPRGLAPMGSSLWLRWPEFGMGLRPVEDARSAEQDRARRVIPWRGARDERVWPGFVRQGERGSWPWVPYTPIDMDVHGHSETGTTA